MVECSRARHGQQTVLGVIGVGMPQAVVRDVTSGVVDHATPANPVVAVKCVGRVRPRPGGDVLLPAVAVALRLSQGWYLTFVRLWTGLALGVRGTHPLKTTKGGAAFSREGTQRVGQPAVVTFAEVVQP